MRLSASRARLSDRRLSSHRTSGDESPAQQAHRLLQQVIATEASAQLTAKEMLQRAVVLAVAEAEEKLLKEAAKASIPKIPEPPPQILVRTTSSLSYSESSSIMSELKPHDGLELPPVRLLRSSWLLKRAATARVAVENARAYGQSATEYEFRRYKLPRRQDLEKDPALAAEAFLTAAEVAALEVNNKGDAARQQMAVVSVSYAWETSEHPDPCLETLFSLADAITRAQRRPISKMRSLPLEVGIFFDWASLPQHPRAAPEEAAFRSALSRMQTWYSHSQTTTLLVTRELASDARPYAERGYHSPVSSIEPVAPRRHTLLTQVTRWISVLADGPRLSAAYPCSTSVAAARCSGRRSSTRAASACWRAAWRHRCRSIRWSGSWRRSTLPTGQTARWYSSSTLRRGARA